MFNPEAQGQQDEQEMTLMQWVKVSQQKSVKKQTDSADSVCILFRAEQVGAISC